jgi:hypothetical protein
VSISTSYQWLTVAQLTDALHHKTAQANKLKLSSLNMARSLLSRASHLDAHKRFLVAVGQGNINGLHRLVSTARRAGGSIYSIVEKCNLAVQGLYRPKSYQEREFQQSFLLLKLGGRTVAEIGHRAFGLPSLEATRRRIGTQPIIASPKMPTRTEMDSNLDHAFQNMPKSSGEIRGVQIGADELKLERRMRWEPRKNVILGICREHSERFGLEFRSMAQAYALRDGLQNGSIHLASEVSFTFEWYFFSSNMHLNI